MSQNWLVLTGALIGALAGLGVAWLTASLQNRFEHKRWLREQKKKAYTDALKSLAAVTIIPIGINLEEIKEWFRRLAEVRESLSVLQAYGSLEKARLVECSNALLRVLYDNDFSIIATEAANLTGTKGDLSCFILLRVHRIDAEIHTVLSEITAIAKLDLEKGD